MASKIKTPSAEMAIAVSVALQKDVAAKRAVMQQALEALQRINDGLICEVAHHEVKHRHVLGESCPVQILHAQAIAALKEQLK